MKKHVLTMCLSFMVIGLWAQDDCEATTEKAHSILYKTTPFADQSTLVALLEPCAAQGDAKAENYLGLVYLNGFGVEKDQQKAFSYISRAANKGYANAQYNLGRLYKYGMGCELSFDNAIDWFKTATTNGNQRAAYSLGYMYYKGFGVSQDYNKAVYWFKKSEDPMAKHFLAICNYFGYGTPVNEKQAVELLTANPTTNSKTFLTYVGAEQKAKNEAAVTQELQNTTTVDSTYIQPEVIEDLNVDIATAPLAKEDITGSWTGKLLQYDWSGTRILRILPITLALDTNKNNTTVQLTTTIAGKVQEATGQYQDGTIYVDSDVHFTLDKLYSSNPYELQLDYTVFTLALEKKTINQSDYLTGYVDTFIEAWTEYGQPFSVVLKPTGTQGDIDEDILEALAAQDNQFIKLYPVPFYDNLTVQYELETASNVFVELYSLHGTNRVTILPTTQQQAGEYTYTIPVNPSLPEGYYVVRILAGEQVYTRMILKGN